MHRVDLRIFKCWIKIISMIIISSWREKVFKNSSTLTSHLSSISTTYTNPNSIRFNISSSSWSDLKTFDSVNIYSPISMDMHVELSHFIFTKITSDKINSQQILTLPQEVGSLLLQRGRLPFPNLLRMSSLTAHSIRGALITLIQHKLSSFFFDLNLSQLESLLKINWTF